MEKQVIFRTGQDLDPDDFNNLQDYTQGAIDHVVADAVTDGRGFAGFATTRTSATKITVDAGRLYSGGVVYLRESSIDFDLTNTLPVTGKKIVLVLVAGSEVETDEQVREFLVDEATMSAEPRTVSMTALRQASVNISTGVEAPDPVDPIYNAGYLAVARVTLNPTGIDDPVMLEENRLPSVRAVAEKVGEVSDATDIVRTKVTAIDSNIASLTARILGTASQEALGRALVRLADLEAKDGIPTTAADSAADYFLETTSSLLTDPSSSCRVFEGIRFVDRRGKGTPVAG